MHHIMTSITLRSYTHLPQRNIHALAEGFAGKEMGFALGERVPAVEGFDGGAVSRQMHNPC